MSVPEQLNDWVTRQADDVVRTAERLRAEGVLPADAPIICASGLSPSGPIHLGNLREVMVPHLVADEIKRRGIPCEHIISWDDYDRFRKVPRGIPGIEDYEQHIGKPYTAIPAPPGSAHATWADHFRSTMTDSLHQLGVDFRGISQSEMYQSGAYVEQVLTAMRERTLLDKILDQYRTKVTEEVALPSAEDVSDDDAAMAEAMAEAGVDVEDDEGGMGSEYFPYRPFCHRCETDFTAVTAYDEASSTLSYVCSQCGHAQDMDLRSDFHGKLVWKIDWPMRWGFEQVLFEPSGVDHQSPGSSYTVGRDVAPVFGWQRPIGPMYAFVGIAGMAKMSSSRGGVPTPADALAIMEPSLLRWLYARKRPNQAFTIAFNAEIQRMYDEWDALERKVSSGKAQAGDVAAYGRSVATVLDGRLTPLPTTPNPQPYKTLAAAVDVTGGDDAQLARVLTAMIGHEVELDSLEPRLSHAATWVRQQPEEERTIPRAEPDWDLLATLGPEQQESLGLLVEHLDDHWSLHDLTTLVYGVPKMQAGLAMDEKDLPTEVKASQREFFTLLYRLLVTRETGPRLPTLLLSLGAGRVRRLLGG